MTDATQELKEYVEYTIEQNSTLFTFEPVGVSPTSKLACFDMDWTLSYGASKLYPSDPDDIYVLPKRRAVLKKLVKDGYSIVVFTNQYAVSKKERTKRCGRVQTFLGKIGVPCWVFIAVGKDKTDKKSGKTTTDPYRKPATGMWTACTKLLGEPSESFFCGDAAGRPQDFSDSDKCFADAAQITFKTPEEVFPPPTPCKPRTGKEMVVFVGMPGCGKTTHYREVYAPKKYIHINQDTLKTKAKVLAKIRDCVAKEKSMVIDATNGPLEKRMEYYSIVENMDYKVTVIYFVRDGRGWNDNRTVNRVPTMGYHRYFKYLDQPTKEEIPGSDEYRGKLRKI